MTSQSTAQPSPLDLPRPPLYAPSHEETFLIYEKNPHEAPPQQTLKIGQKKYDIISYLGSGGFSDVFLIKRSGGVRQAIKRILPHKKDKEQPYKLGAPCLMEASIMSSYIHPHLTTSSQIEVHNSALFIFQEVAICDVDSWRQTIKPTFEQTRILFHSILSALSYLHSEGIIHADVKDQNILVYGSRDFRLADGSLACFSEWGKTHRPNTACYRPPEAWVGLCKRAESFAIPRRPEVTSPEPEWNEKVDIFALGCTMYRVLFNHHLFPAQRKESNRGRRSKRYMNAILDWVAFYENFSPMGTTSADIRHYDFEYHEPYVDSRLLEERDDLMEMVVSTLHPFAGARPSANALLGHPLFDDLIENPPRGYRRQPKHERRQLDSTLLDDLSAYESPPEVLHIARLIKGRYFSALDPQELPGLNTPRMDILNSTILWIARKFLRSRDQNIPRLPRAPRFTWGEIYKLEASILSTVEFMLH